MKLYTAIFLALVTLVLGYFAASANDDEFWEEAPTEEQVSASGAAQPAGRVPIPPATVKSLAIPKELPIGAEQWEVKSVDITSPAEGSGPPSAVQGQAADGEQYCCEHISIDITLERKPDDKPEHTVAAPRD